MTSPAPLTPAELAALVTADQAREALYSFEDAVASVHGATMHVPNAERREADEQRRVVLNYISQTESELARLRALFEDDDDPEPMPTDEEVDAAMRELNMTDADIALMAERTRVFIRVCMELRDAKRRIADLTRAQAEREDTP